MIDKAKLNALIEREGGSEFTSLPADRGGPTRWGVTEQVARAFGYGGHMRDLPRETAEAIYVQRYWSGPRFDRLAQVSEKVAEKCFDIGVNMGPVTAGRFLQRALNVLNRQAADWPDVAVDGQVGPMTLQALRQLLARRGQDGEAELANMLDALQRVRYIEIAERDPTQETFSFGWQRRASAVA